MQKEVGGMDDLLLRKMCDDDIDTINALYIEEYGPHYPYLLKSDIQRFNEGVLIVAESCGQIVGFARAATLGHYTGVYEFGGLIIRNSYRESGIAQMLTIARVREVHSRGCTAVYSEPVCYRQDKSSQAVLERFKFVYTGILPFKYPALKPEVLGAQPESVVVALRAVHLGLQLQGRALCIPASIRATIESILSLEKLEEGQMLHDCQMPEVIISDPVEHGGMQGAAFADVPANWVESNDAIEALMQNGFLFGALLPGFGQTQSGQRFDYIVMFKPPQRVALTMDLVHVPPSLVPMWWYLKGKLG
ncbi:MAG: GNAT family N-acetyltransferase [Patescibacteria group bacterium]